MNESNKAKKVLIFKSELPKPVFLEKPVLDDQGKDTGYMITEHSELYDPFGRNITSYTKDHRPFGYIEMNGCKRSYSLTRISKRAFEESNQPIENYKDVVDHVDPNVPLNNHVSNLEWVSVGENRRRAHNLNQVDYSDKTEKVHRICQLICKGVSRQDIAKAVGVNTHMIDDIKAGRSHRNISEQYLDKGFEYRMFDRTDRDLLIHEICKMIEAGERTVNIVRKLNLKNQCLVNDIKAGRSHRNISKNYNF